LLELIEEHALTHETIDTTRLRRIREEMERAEARRLQPHFIASFFREAFTLLGGTLREREPKRYEITHVPAVIRNRDRVIGVGEPVLTRYERITFEKDLISVPGKPLAAFVCPGHPLLDATLDLVLERYRDLLKRGSVLVDPHNQNDEVRVLFYLEHAIQDGRVDSSGALVVPQGLLVRLRGETTTAVEISQVLASRENGVDRERINRLAVAAVMEVERGLGREPKEMPHENPGYDIESRDANNNRLLFIEVKGKAAGSTTVTVSKTQILTALNKPDDFILAIVEVGGNTVHEPRYIRQPFQKEPDFGVTSVNYNLNELLSRAETPR
jgi:hypothetical protein